MTDWETACKGESELLFGNWLQGFGVSTTYRFNRPLLPLKQSVTPYRGLSGS